MMEIGEEAAAGNTALSANDAAETEKEENCAPNAIHGNTVVVISADHIDVYKRQRLLCVPG